MVDHIGIVTQPLMRSWPPNRAVGGLECAVRSARLSTPLSPFLREEILQFLGIVIVYVEQGSPVIE